MQPVLIIGDQQHFGNYQRNIFTIAGRKIKFCSFFFCDINRHKSNGVLPKNMFERLCLFVCLFISEKIVGLIMSNMIETPNFFCRWAKLKWKKEYIAFCALHLLLFVCSDEIWNHALLLDLQLFELDFWKLTRKWNISFHSIQFALPNSRFSPFNLNANMFCSNQLPMDYSWIWLDIWINESIFVPGDLVIIFTHDRSWMAIRHSAARHVNFAQLTRAYEKN